MTRVPGITVMTGIPRMTGMTMMTREGTGTTGMTGMTGVAGMNGMTVMTGITTIMDKSPWDSNAIFILFLSFLGSLIKRCIPFEIFLQLSLSPSHPHPI